jgi:hypothetical protein
MLNFLNKDESTAEIKKLIDNIEYKNFRIISMEVVSWLQRQHKYKNSKPLKLRSDYEWCNSLKVAVETWPALNDLLEVDAGECNFRDTVSEEDRSHLRKMAEQLYQPVLRTKAKRLVNY